MSEPLLETRALTKHFKVGGNLSRKTLHAVDDANLVINRNEIVALVGESGSGKSTLARLLARVYQPTSGGIRFRGESIVGKKKHEITRGGIARTFQNVRLFPEMTALENVMVGADAHHKTSVISALFRLPRFWREEKSGRERSLELLRFVGIAHRAGDVSRNLSYGEQRRLEIARALATNPTLLCLDEPAAGFNPAEKEDLLQLIRRIRDTGVTVLLIEHDMRLVMGVTDRIVVLEFGKKIAEGTPAEVRDNPAVIAAYLGVPTDAA
jgi:branched-chain amino acid transport system ATP-binding protein